MSPTTSADGIHYFGPPYESLGDRPTSDWGDPLALRGYAVVWTIGTLWLGPRGRARQMAPEKWAASKTQCSSNVVLGEGRHCSVVIAAKKARSKADVIARSNKKCLSPILVDPVNRLSKRMTGAFAWIIPPEKTCYSLSSYWPLRQGEIRHQQRVLWPDSDRGSLCVAEAEPRQGSQ